MQPLHQTNPDTFDCLTRVGSQERLVAAGDPVRVTRGVYTSRAGVIESFTSNTVEGWAVVRFGSHGRDLIRCDCLLRIMQ